LILGGHASEATHACGNHMQPGARPPPGAHFGTDGAQGPAVAKILFVSDDDELAYVCQLVLEARGHRVEVVADGDEADARLASFTPQLLVIERELADDLDLRALHVPVVMLSGLRQAEDEAYGAGANAFILKPFVSSELLAAIDRLLPPEERRIA
jgi:DNA-binding response OmpR family regulator